MYKSCGCCGSYKIPKQCSGCKVLRYCSAKCQEIHWKRAHKLDCKKIVVIENDPSKVYFMMSEDHRLYRELYAPLVLGSTIINIKIKLLRWEVTTLFVLEMTPSFATGIFTALEANYGFKPENNSCIIVSTSAVEGTKIRTVLTDYRQQFIDTPIDCNYACKDRKQLIITWLLVCKRLGFILPLELHFMIIPYIVSDVRVCKRMRPRVVPLLGPNVFI